ncbi:carbohydrate deacetylase-like isoform X1 [Physella acuta]|uniref:carbohydrate deacetylase-like isoform X1 n=1 Tax=Physella acuta TaxID=109671 RepID=UPI0027DCA1FA|nr:carbohydrate deacetylase-like isoform X1 [Physella acuta]XP_059143756.1 carbohydrate deacetylase-like isoform X1 [Physella acuta]
MKRYLIITADDFGFSKERNAGVVQAFNHGAVKSASLLLNCTGTEEGAKIFQSSSICHGLHLNLTEGLPISSENFKTLTDSTGIFHGMINTPKLLDEGYIDKEEIRQEIDSQIDRYIELVGSAPVYVDGHQHIHLHPKVVDIFCDALKRHNIQVTRFPNEVNMESKSWVNPEYMPFFSVLIEQITNVRVVLDNYGIRTTDCFAGLSTMGKDMTVERLQKVILEAFQEAEKRTLLSPQDKEFTSCELMTHPGHPTDPNFGGFSWGSDEFGLSSDRVYEIKILSSPEMKEFYKANNIELVSHNVLCS